MRTIVLGAALALSACAGSDTTVCAGGGVCPAGLACVGDDARDPAACAAAGGFVDDARCYLCVLPTCGDGVLDSGEACDDGNRTSGDGCPASCAAACGDGLRDPGEACDDHNLVDDDGCNVTCSASSTTWVRLGDEPAPRTQTALTYDAVRGRVVLYGGRDLATDTLLGDTWEWDGVTWTERATAGGSPGPRAGHAMAYDAARGRVVLFGGIEQGGTWEWDGSTWTAAPSMNQPAPRAWAAMAYDAARREVVLFGGCGGTLPIMCGGLDDTWTWDGITWTLRHPAAAPSARTGAAMAFDPRRGVLVLVGGFDPAVPGPRDDVWIWDGAAWRRDETSGGLPARYQGAIAYDARRERIVVFGGQGGIGASPLADAWELGAAGWQPRTGDAQPPAGVPAMTYDLARDELLLVDGLAGAPLTWRGDGASWRAGWTGSAPPPRHGAAMAASEGVLLLFGGADRDRPGPLGDGWLRSGSVWLPASSVVAPSARHGQAISAGREGFVMFGGRTGVGLTDETWVWRDGWFLHPSVMRPSPRAYHAMAYDEARQRVVLFGGNAGGPAAVSDETWEFDGNGWTLLHPATTPPARMGHAMAYDRERRTVVMFGGRGDDGAWEWDGVDWTRRRPAIAPRARAGAGLAYDVARHRTVLFGGCDDIDAFAGQCMGPMALDDLWEWDGDAWRALGPAPGPGARGLVAMTYDPSRRRVVLFGGQGGTPLPEAALGDTWEWDGERWTQPTASWGPTPRRGAALAGNPSHGRAVLFGGGVPMEGRPDEVLSDTWELAGGTWIERAPATSPPARQRAALATYPRGGSVLLFGGGAGANLRLGDTWLWDGDAWHLLASARAPSARSRAAIATDPLGEIVLFGGDVAEENVVAGDTWIWNSSSGQWSPRTPAAAPSARAGAAMAFDPLREVVVLFGGRDAQGPRADTWVWDRETWRELHPSTIPPARSEHAMAFDPGRGTIVMFGGGDGSTWEWDGVDWRRADPAAAPSGRTDVALAFHPGLGRVVAFGGLAGGPPLGDTWLFGYRNARGGESCTTGFDGDRDGQVGCNDADCAGVCATCHDGTCGPFDDCHACSDCGACDQCGDLRCDPGETRASCPGDCRD